MRHSDRPRRHGIIDPELIAKIRGDIPPERVDTQRQMKFFVVPGGRRLTEYETLTVYAQQGTDWASGGLEIGDSMQKWPGGRPTYAPETTELKTTDWWRFRDPDGKWFFPAVKEKAEEGRYLTRFMKNYSETSDIARIDLHWLSEIIGKHYGAFLYSEYGLFNAHASVIHDCLSDVLRVFFCNLAFDKNDTAQMLQTQRVFVHKMVPKLPASLDAGKALWTADPIYAGARETVEALWADTFDHMEAMWAVHSVYDAIFGRYVRREFFSKLAPFHNDAITPTFLSQPVNYMAYALRGSRSLYVDCLLEDPRFSDLNRRWLHLWTTKWISRTLQALTDFMGVYEHVESIPGQSDREGVERGLREIIGAWCERVARPIGFAADRDAMVKRVMGGYRGGA